MTETMSAPSNELNFTEDGVKPEEKTWTVARSEVVEVEKDGGTGKEWQVDLQTDDEPFVRTLRYWIQHDEVSGKNWEQAVQIGRAAAKRFTRAVTGGETALASPGEIVGKKLVATVGEDNQGYTKFSKFKTAEAPEAIS